MSTYTPPFRGRSRGSRTPLSSSLGHRIRLMLGGLLIVAASGVAVACEPEAGVELDADGTDGNVPVVTIRAFDYGFDAPAEVPAGLTEVRVANDGAEPHHVQLVRLTGEETVDDVMQAIEAGGPPPDWAIPEGGPNGAEPGMTTSAFVDLQEGRYALLCAIPSPDGVPHAAKGMVAEMAVGPGGDGASPPAPDVVVEGTEFAFDVQGQLTTGVQTVRFDNRGEQPHEAFLVRLNEGATANDYIAAFGPEASGPPPGTLVGGIVAVAPGMSQTFTVDASAPGTYAWICAIEDTDTGVPHFAVGMQDEFPIE